MWNISKRSSCENKNEAKYIELTVFLCPSPPLAITWFFWSRTGSFGALVHGPTGHWFYGMLDSKMPGTAPMTVVTKVAIDQVCKMKNKPATPRPLTVLYIR